jgi:hypothetical protein
MENPMKRIRAALLILAASTALSPLMAQTTITYYVPIATQVKGNVQYRTSVLLTNQSAAVTQPPVFLFRYRSPVDGTFQTAGALGPRQLGPLETTYYDDIIAAFNSVGAIRAADANQQLFGTLEVQLASSSSASVFGEVIARTYSPTFCGFVGLAYKATDGVGATTLTTTVRHDTGGTMETRTNVGLINRGTVPTDVTLTFFDGNTGAQVFQYQLSSRAGHILAPGEVVQLNNVLSDPALSGLPNRNIVLRATTATQPIEGYAVILDGTSNDGSFYTMTPPPAAQQGGGDT